MYQVITAKLVSRTAIHLGSGSASDLTDSLIRRSTQGKPIIPGTTLAGILRSLLTRLAPRFFDEICLRLQANKDQSAACFCPVCTLLGNFNPSDEFESSHASRLLVYNAELIAAQRPQIRDGVGIHRSTGAAARTVKYDLELLPTNSQFLLRLELRSTEPRDHQLVALALSEWQNGRAWIGGRVGRGLGAFDLKEVKFKRWDFDNGEKLVRFLREAQPWEQAEIQPDWQVKTLSDLPPVKPLDEKMLNQHLAQTYFQVSGTLAADGPILTHDTTNSGTAGFDHAPLLANSGEWVQPVLSGAGLRGVLRSHAERLLRTLASQTAATQQKAETWFLQHCPACSPVENSSGQPLASCDSLLKQAGVASEEELTDDQLCLACQLFGSVRRGSRLILEDAPFDAEAAGGEPQYKMLDFLAIDRFTGGGADKLKFDALALWKPAFRFSLYLENPKAWEIGLLLLTLRDVQSGWLRFGMGAAKGFGQAHLQNPQYRLGYLHPQDIQALGLQATTPSVNKDRFSVYTEKILDLHAKEVEDCLEKLRSMNVVRGAEKGKPPLLAQDSYFGKLDHLYPFEGR